MIYLESAIASGAHARGSSHKFIGRIGPSAPQSYHLVYAARSKYALQSYKFKMANVTEFGETYSYSTIPYSYPKNSK